MRRSTRVINRPNNLIPNKAGRSVKSEDVAVKLQVEYTSKITMEVEKKNTVDDVINACMLQLYLKYDQERFGNKGGEAVQK